MNLTACTIILPVMGKKLLFMLLLVASSILCTTKAEYEQFVPAQIKPESISYSEATNFFIKNEQYFTDEQKLELLKKIGTLADDDVPSVSPKQQLLRGIGGTKITTNSMMQLAMNTEDTKPSKTAIEAMEEAIESSEKAVEYLQSLTANIIDRAIQVKDEVAKWKNKIAGLTNKSMNDYVVKVSQVTVILNESSVEAENLMQTMLDMVTLVINRMKLHVDDDDLLKEAVIDVQNMMGTQMKATALGLKELESKVAEAQTGFEVVAEMSESYSQVITNNLNNKSGYIDKKADSLRKKAYGGCAACVIMPWSCPICYATAAGVVETKIKELKDDLRRTKNSLNSIKSHFDSLHLQCDDLKTTAATQYDNINNIRINLTTTSKLVVATDALRFWKGVILPRLESLRSLLARSADQLEGYKFTPYKDSHGYDIKKSSSNDIQSYARECNEDARCKGFNSNGWIKHHIRDSSEWNTWTNEASKGFYLKLTPSTATIVVAIRSVSSGNYLDGRNPEHTGIQIHLTNRPPEGDKYLHWTLTKLSDGTYNIRSISSNLFIDGRDPQHKGRQVKLQAVSETQAKSSNYFKWRITNYTYGGRTRVAIQSVSSGLYLDGRNPSHTGNQLYLTARNPQGDGYLMWDLESMQ